MFSWRKLLERALADNGEEWSDIVEHTLTEEQLDAPFDDQAGRNGAPFTLWTFSRVYFPATHDDANWVDSVARNPDGLPTEHIGI